MPSVVNNPAIARYVHWRRSEVATIRVSMVHGYDPDVPLKLHLTKMIENTLADTKFIRYYESAEIDRIFNDTVLKGYAQGRYYDSSLRFREKLKDYGAWGDLVFNIFGAAYANLEFILGTLEDKELPAAAKMQAVEEADVDIQDSLMKLKIIEDWISYNPEFMREVLAKVK